MGGILVVRDAIGIGGLAIVGRVIAFGLVVGGAAFMPPQSEPAGRQGTSPAFPVGSHRAQKLGRDNRERTRQRLLRLEAPLEEQDRSRDRYDAAIGTLTELGAYAGLRAAGEQVTARGAWLN